MKIFNLIFTFVCCFFMPVILQGKVIVSDDIHSIVSVEKHASVFIDSSSNLLIDDVKMKKDLFVPFSDNYMVLSSGRSYWLKLHILNRKEETLNWVLNFYDPDFRIIEFYDQEKKYTSGVEFPFTTKRFFHKNFVFAIHLEPNEERVYWIKMQSESGAIIKADLTTIEAHDAYALSEYYVLGLYYGILLILVAYNLILFFHTRHQSYVLYVLYLLSAILFSFNEDGLGFQFLWGSFPEFNLILRVLSPLLFQLSFLAFAISFLEIEKGGKHTKILLLLYVVSLVMSVGQYFQFIATSISFLFYLFPFAHLLFITFQKAQNRHSDSVYFFIGNSLVLLSLVVYYFRLNNWIYSGIFEVYIFNFSVVIESLVLTLAVGNKIRNGIFKQQKIEQELIQSLEEQELLATKVNRELEEKVAQRTAQLEEQKNKLERKNTELVELKEKLYKMNEAFDLANFKLKKEAQTYSKDKIQNKEIAYESFLELYKDQFTCTNYLFELKKKVNMVCTKCGENDFKEKDKTTKQCNNCKKIDSATSGTIFHALKFPLPKAFYLLYITNFNKSKYTLDQLSELLDLGRNSCWNFINKVEAKKKELTKGGKRQQVSFDELIL